MKYNKIRYGWVLVFKNKALFIQILRGPISYIFIYYIYFIISYQMGMMKD